MARKSAKCCKCSRRFPFLPLLADILCLIGCLSFATTGYMATRIISHMYEDIYYVAGIWKLALRVVLIICCLLTCVYSFYVLIISYSVYSGSVTWVTSHLGSRCSIAICFLVTYILLLLWLCVFFYVTCVTFAYFVAENVCRSVINDPDRSDCVDTADMAFLYFYAVPSDNFLICFPQYSVLCLAYIVPAALLMKIATIAVLCIIISLIHLLIFLATHWTRIRVREEFDEFKCLNLAERDALNEPAEIEGFLRVFRCPESPNTNNINHH